jgi:hypothetical protein
MKQFLFSFLFLLTSYCLFGQDTTGTDTSKPAKVLYEITRLSKMADSEKYGLTGEFPVKVGTGPRGGPANQRAYLELLRDGQGNPVEYKRVGGGCCPYKSENAMFGDYALVDSYEVVYKNKDGKKKKAIIYISFYDYEEPMIPVGFQAASSQ